MSLTLYRLVGRFGRVPSSRQSRWRYPRATSHFRGNSFTGAGRSPSRIGQMNKDYKKMFGHNPESLQGVALGGDLIYEVKAAVEKAGSMDGSKVAAAMNTLTNIQGVTGPIIGPTCHDVL